VQQSYPNPVLNSLMQKLTETEQELAKLLKDMGANHPDVKRTVVLRDEIEKQIDDQTDGVMRGLMAKMQAAQVTAKELETRLQQARLNFPPAAATAASTPEPADPETEEIKRLEATIKDSPDLINAYEQGIPDNPLLRSARNGRLKVAAFLLDHKANIEIREQGGNADTPLLAAAKHGHKEMVELLLTRGADVNAAAMRSTPNPGQMVAGGTALHYAAELGYKSIGEVLLAHGANVDGQNVDKQTPLHVAAKKGFKAVAELLLAHGANPNAKDQDGETPLLAAVKADNQVIVELLLANKADVNSKTAHGWTPLHSAARGDRVEIAKLLLAAGADANARTDQGATPLTSSAENGSSEIIKLLLANKADVNARQDDGDTALLVAVNNKRLENARLLLANNAEVNITSSVHSGPPLHSAVDGGSTEIVKAILARNPDLEVLDGNRHTPLQLAIIKPQLEIAGLLLDAGADPNVPYKDVDNASPLQLAAVRLDKPMVELLVAHKADLNLQDRYGNTALSRMRELAAGKTPSPRAQIAGREIAELLRKAGADENLQRLSIIGVSRGNFEQNLFFRGQIPITAIRSLNSSSDFTDLKAQ
ncbi:MAG TPA: ankyrin repeat domain-containing protein, partial [Verrucomicrobiae bacterium]|nr:ankyrin repeat domain-containing protein [Verrucomicrobiae bacterium]